jgi:hypothetical protein
VDLSGGGVCFESGGQELLDDLWGLGLAHLAQLPAYEAQVNARTRPVGRNLEPWRAILAVALCLQDNGVAGIFERMEALSMAYQQERPDLEAADTTTVVLKALLRLWQDRGADEQACANDANGANDAKLANGLVVASKTIKSSTPYGHAVRNRKSAIRNSTSGLSAPLPL